MNDYVTNSATQNSAIQGSDAVILDSTDAAIVIAIASAQQQDPTEPPELVDATTLHEWLFPQTAGGSPPQAHGSHLAVAVTAGRPPQRRHGRKRTYLPPLQEYKGRGVGHG
jgi:hypothetical protein